MAGKKIKNELDIDYQLIGIASSIEEYKLCHYLNNNLNCKLCKLPDLVFKSAERTTETTLSVFKAGDKESVNRFFVFTNKNKIEALLPEVSNFDYIVQIIGKYEPEEMKRFIEAIRQFPHVVMTTQIPVKKIKSKERVVYE